MSGLLPGRQRNGALELTPRARPLVRVHRGHTERDMRLGQCRVERQRPMRGVSRCLTHLWGGDTPEVRHQLERHAEARIRPREITVARDCPAERLNRLLHAASAALQQVAAAKIEIVGLGVQRPAHRRLRPLLRPAEPQGTRDTARDVVLEREDIGRAAVVAIRPHFDPIGRARELRRHTQLALHSTHRALQYVRHPKRASGLANIHVALAAIAPSKTPRCDLHAAQLADRRG